MSIARSVGPLTRAAVALAAGLLVLGTAVPASAAEAPPTPDNFQLNNVTATSVSMQWAPGYLTGPTRWRVLRDGDPVTTRWNSAYTDTGLTPGRTYSYSVVAVGADGTTSAPTRTLTVTTRDSGADAGAPADPRVVDLAPARVTIEFDRPADEFDVYSYRVYDGDTQVASVGRTPYNHPTGTATVRELEPGSTHTFTVRAYRRDGLSAPSEPLTVTTPTTTDTTAPTVPTGLSWTLTPYACTVVDLTWNQSTDDRDAAGEIEYEVFAGDDRRSTVRGTGEALSVWLVDDGPEHELTVRAVDSSGNASDHSDPVTVTLDPHCRR